MIQLINVSYDAQDAAGLVVEVQEERRRSTWQQGLPSFAVSVASSS